jgi:hypothetical protein
VLQRCVSLFHEGLGPALLVEDCSGTCSHASIGTHSSFSGQYIMCFDLPETVNVELGKLFGHCFTLFCALLRSWTTSLVSLTGLTGVSIIY